jgi:hypothetical protein
MFVDVVGIAELVWVPEHIHLDLRVCIEEAVQGATSGVNLHRAGLVGLLARVAGSGRGSLSPEA